MTLRDVENLPMRDVSSLMGIGLSASKMRVHRGRVSLCVALQEDARERIFREINARIPDPPN